METHSSILAWEIPWTEESGGLQSIGLQTGQDSSDLARTHTQEGERERESKKTGGRRKGAEKVQDNVKAGQEEAARASGC